MHWESGQKAILHHTKQDPSPPRRPAGWDHRQWLPRSQIYRADHRMEHTGHRTQHPDLLPGKLPARHSFHHQFHLQSGHATMLRCPTPPVEVLLHPGFQRPPQKLHCLPVLERILDLHLHSRQIAEQYPSDPRMHPFQG